VWHLPASVSRAAVVVCALGSTALSGSFWYARAIDGDPVRLARGADGAVRLMTRLEALEERAAAAAALAAAAPGDAARVAVVGAWRGAIDAERARLRAAGVDPDAAAAADDDD